MSRNLIVVILLAGLAGCSSIPKPAEPADWGPSEPLEPELTQTPGAIYGGAGLELFADVRARAVGDVLTILLVESTAGSNASSTSASKGSDVSTSIPLFAGRPVTSNGTEILSNELTGDRSFTGQADTSQSNSLSGSITVTVADRLANGNLVVRGEKWVTINQSREYIRIAGIVRPVDIAPDNTISSTQVANAEISYRGDGTLADSNRPGWLSRFFNSVWFPF